MTFSIVARDDRTGRFGVAVSSCVLAIGTRVPAVRVGVGAVVVQADGKLPWRTMLLDLLDGGVSASDAVAALGAAADLGATQVAVVGTAGAAAAHTGQACGGFAGHASAGPVSAQANTMASERAWPAMLEAFQRAYRGVGSRADRGVAGRADRGVAGRADDGADGLVDGLVAALVAAQAEGGDLRGRQSAALLVTSVQRGVEATGNADDPVVDLRVDDARDPVGELARLVRVHRAHRRLIRASMVADEQAALDEMRRAAAEAPDDPLCSPAAGIALALAGEVDDGIALVRHAMTVNPAAARWARQRARDALAAGNPSAEAFLAGVERLSASNS